MSADWLIEPFDKKRHNRADFSCGYDELDDYLHQQASSAQRYRTAAIFVLVQPDELIVRGYYTLSNTIIEPADLPDEQKKRFRVNPVPATLLGRLAVDSRFQHQRLGRKLLHDAFARAEQLSRASGSVAVVVDAIDNKAREWYVERSFIQLQDDPNHLFMLMSTIKGLPLPAVQLAASLPPQT